MNFTSQPIERLTLYTTGTCWVGICITCVAPETCKEYVI